MVEPLSVNDLDERCPQPLWEQQEQCYSLAAPIHKQAMTNKLTLEFPYRE